MLVNHRAQKTPIRLTLTPIINDQQFNGTLAFTFPPDFLEPPSIASVNILYAPTFGPDTTQYLALVTIANNQSFGSLAVALGTPQAITLPTITNAQTFHPLTIGPPPGIVDALLVSSKYLKVNNSDYLRIQE